MSINNTHLIENDMTYLLLIMYIKRHIEVVRQGDAFLSLFDEIQVSWFQLILYNIV